MSDKLKPCPFCGASGVVYMVYNSMFETNTYTVVCSNEDSCPVNYLSMKCHRTEQEAIEAWNTRADDAGECEQEENGWGTEGDHARVWLTCGHDCMVDTVADLPNYCPTCGAKVRKSEPQVIENAGNYKLADDSRPQVIANAEKYELSDDAPPVKLAKLLNCLENDYGILAEWDGLRCVWYTQRAEPLAVENAQADSREKLEEDAFEFASYLLYANYDGVDDIPVNAGEKREIRELLDRQAAITRAEVFEDGEFDCMTCGAKRELQERVDSLTAELYRERKSREYAYNGLNKMLALDGKRVKQINELTAERDELRGIIAHMPKTEQECEVCQEAHDRLMFNAKVDMDELRDELKHKQLVIDRQRDSFLKLEAENAELRKMLADAAEAI